MADKNTIEQMLEHLVNGDQAKAEELFHEYVVEASREIYESMIESEMSDEEDKDEEVDEAAEDDEAEEDKVEENFDEFEDLTIEADDEESDPTDDLLADVEMDDEEGEMDGEEGEEDLESKVMDLEDAVEELEAKFAELAGDDHEEPDADNMGGMSDNDADNMGDMDGMGDEEKMKDSFDQELATMREYVEKVAGGHGAEKKGAGETGADTKSPVAGKNDMGGTTANIAKGGEGGGSDKGLLGKGTKDLGVNGPKEAAKGAFTSKVTAGHGAEKKGAAEQADNKQSLFRK